MQFWIVKLLSNQTFNSSNTQLKFSLNKKATPRKEVALRRALDADENLNDPGTEHFNDLKSDFD